jgi:hypothetical protein
VPEFFCRAYRPEMAMLFDIVNHPDIARILLRASRRFAGSAGFPA